MKARRPDSQAALWRGDIPAASLSPKMAVAPWRPSLSHWEADHAEVS
jgi:hypothetical protein